MIAYSKKELENLHLKVKADLWRRKKIITTEQLQNISDLYKCNFYDPHTFIRVSLFVFTTFLYFSCSGIFFLVTFSMGDEFSYMGARSFICSLIGFFLLEQLIQNKKLYRSGIDEALLYCSSGQMLTGLFLIFEIEKYDEIHMLIYVGLISLPLLLLIGIRYLDKVAWFFANISLLALIGGVVMLLGEIAEIILPFVCMAIGLLLYMISSNILLVEKFYIWKEGMVVTKICGLFLFYFSGNYFVIREASVNFFGAVVEPGKDIPLAYIFYLFTIAVPVYYIIKGLKDKNRTMLRVGMILVVLSVLTFKYYYGFNTPEITLTIAGIIAIGVAYLTIKFLKNPVYGVYFAKEESENDIFAEHSESFLASQIGISQVNSPDNIDLGGGKFGGGGGSGTY